MENNNRIEKILQEYHEFCLSLLSKVPVEILDQQQQSQQAYIFKEELQKEISQRKTSMDYYSPTILELRDRIVDRSK